ncbi:MAG TPA: glycosyltransferase family 9 protein [Verrucomicrobiota bacterium]|nr:glycosyltransferase family 9 protein [Verrucomicrobiota bacterium]
MTGRPQSILLLKGHSAGVGDLLRSSAAWRALIDTYPEARLHLVFLTQEPGYASEELISHHHLLRSFHVLPKWPGTLAEWREATRWFLRVARETAADLVIDFEPNGLRTSLLTWLARRRLGVQTVGVAEVPGRGLFYQLSAPSRRAYAQKNGQELPLNYAELDFVALAAIGIHRDGRAIELRETPLATTFRENLSDRFHLPLGVPLVGINVGCGTPGALDRRPDLPLMRALLGRLQAEHHCAVVLTGAPFERDVNDELLNGYSPPTDLPVVNLAGHTRLLELPGVINACSQFISADSGPYHIAVGLRVPTIVIFNAIHRAAEHHHPWVQCVLAPSLSELPRLEVAVRELRTAFPWSSSPVPA